MTAGDTVPWRALLDETVGRLRAAGFDAADLEARWLIEEITGMDGADLLLGLDDPATQRGVARLDELVARRTAGEPIQYVLGRWSFRRLDLLCDRRVLIPRPETEQIVGFALDELDRIRSHQRYAGRRGADEPLTVVDLGTGSGAIALSVAVERPGTDVWGIDASADALAVARANLGGLGMAGARVRFEEGSWFEPLPAELRGEIDVIVSNPPYVGSDEPLDESVRDWEPVEALIAGETGLEDLEAIIEGAAGWLGSRGALVLEIGAGQAEAVRKRLETAGFREIRVEVDHAGLDRGVIARRG